jgi:hypothetical protein
LKLSAFRKKKASAKDNWIIYHRAPTLFPAKSNTSLRKRALQRKQEEYKKQIEEADSNQCRNVK